MLVRLKCYVVKKKRIFSTSTQIIESVYVPRHNSLSMLRSRLLKSISEILEKIYQ